MKAFCWLFQNWGVSLVLSWREIWELMALCGSKHVLALLGMEHLQTGLLCNGFGPFASFSVCSMCVVCLGFSTHSLCFAHVL